jgi:glycosyltransferase involved in cell wall biosynthesis
VTALPAIHQWAAGAGTGDAITGYVLALQKIIRSWGAESDFFVDYRHVSFDMRRHCRDLRSFPDRLPDGSIVLYHFSIGSEATARFLALPPGVVRVVTYHNITPARYFRSLLPETAAVLAEGREQLRLLAPAIDLALGDSSYNCAEMEEAGCGKTALVPLIRNEPDPGLEPDPLVLSHYGDGAVNWLTVGRVAPNKKVEDVIKAFYYYRRAVQPHARLFIVGSGMPHYLSALQALTVQLDLPGVIFAGHVSASELVAYYRLADVLLSMSEHEGFCLPLLEAMSFDVPVLAYAAAAVPETVGDGGVVFGRKDYRAVAELAHLAATPGEVRRKLIAAGRSHLEKFSAARVEVSLRQALDPLLQPKPGS